MQKSCKIIIFMLVFSGGLLFKQNGLFGETQQKITATNQNVKQNFTIIDSLVEKAVDEIIEKILRINDFDKDTIHFNISTNEASWLVQKHLINKLSKSVLINNNSTKKNFIDLTIENIELNYSFADKSNNLVIRDVSLKLFVALHDKNYQVLTFENKQKSEDTLSYTQLEFANRSNFEFAKAEIPNKKLSIWSKYLEPTIAVVSAAIVTTLFFTVRSK